MIVKIRNGQKPDVIKSLSRLKRLKEFQPNLTWVICCSRLITQNFWLAIGPVKVSEKGFYRTPLTQRTVNFMIKILLFSTKTLPVVADALNIPCANFGWIWTTINMFILPSKTDFGLSRSGWIPPIPYFFALVEYVQFRLFSFWLYKN